MIACFKIKQGVYKFVLNFMENPVKWRYSAQVFIAPIRRQGGEKQTFLSAPTTKVIAR